MWQLAQANPIEKEHGEDGTMRGLTRPMTACSVINELVWRGFPGGSDGEESACSAGDAGSVPGSGRSPGEGNGNPLQYSCLGNPMDRGAWWATAPGVARELDTT